MSKFVPVENVAKRPKRATRACDHCRWKRLKCSDERKDQSCMNCVIYGVECLYSTTYSPSSTRKGGEGSSNAAAGGGKAGSSGSGAAKKRGGSGVGRDTASQSPGRINSNRDSPSSSSYPDEVGYGERQGRTNGMLPKFASARGLAAEFAKSAHSDVDLEQLSQRIDHYAAFLTDFSENHNSPVEILSEDTGLPPQPIANALLQAYADGYQTGHHTATTRWRNTHLQNARRSRSMHEFSPALGADPGMELASPMALDHMSAAAVAAQHPHAHLYADPATAVSMSGLDMNAMAATSQHQDYALPLHHGAPRSAVQRQMTAEELQRHGQHAPRSVPQGLSLAIPGAAGHQWAQQHGPHSAPTEGPMHMNQGYGNHSNQGYF